MINSILVRQHESWTEITLNRPRVLNSFNDDMHLALRDVLETAAAANVRSVLLTGAGRGFCAGQDLKDRDPAGEEPRPDLGRTVRTQYAPLVRRIRSLRCPVVCAVNGVAAGAGASLALACDIVLAAESATFIQSFAKVGLVPDTGGSWHLPRLLGEARAKGLALTAEPLPARKAEDWGLIWKTLPDAELMPSARKLAASLAAGPTLGLGLTKQAIQAAGSNTLNEQLDLEASMMETCGGSEDYAEGVRAFHERRPPDFRGR